MRIIETGQILDCTQRKIKKSIDYSLFSNNVCRNCGSFILDSKTCITQKINEFEISVSCRLDYKTYKSIVCWDCRPPHSSNPNSVKYNMLKFGLSEQESRNLIHSRNKSPFYKINHENPQKYKEFQGHSDFSEEKKKNIIEKQKNSMNEYHNKILKDGGKELMSKIKDSSSVNFHIKKYGEVEGIKKFKEKGLKTRSPLLTEVKTVEQMTKHLSVQYNIKTKEDLLKWFSKKTQRKNLISIYFFIKRTNLDKHSVPIIFGSIVFKIENLYEFFSIKEQKEFIEKKINPRNSTYIYNGVIDGHYFRSGNEIQLYKSLIENSIVVLDTNKSYPNDTKKFYDISILLNDKKRYLEIIGFSDTIYKEKLKQRVIDYDSILISPKYFSEFISDIKANRQIRNLYNDW